MYPPGYTTGDEFDEIPDGRFEYIAKQSHKKHMGEMADWMLDQAMMSLEDEDWDEPETIKPKIPKGHWKTKDGRIIPIRSMSDSHLKNCIALCERRGVRVSDLNEEMERREKVKEGVRHKTDPVYDAFCAGWVAGQKAANDEAYPDVGFNLPKSKINAWNEYKIKNVIDRSS